MASIQNLNLNELPILLYWLFGKNTMPGITVQMNSQAGVSLKALSVLCCDGCGQKDQALITGNCLN